MENLGFGLQITVLGMGLVFGLLTLMWALLALVGRLDRPPAEAPEPVSEAPPAPTVVETPALTVSGPAAGELTPEAIAAITAAVIAHTSYRRRQAAPAMRSYWPGSLLFASRWVAAGRTRQTKAWQRRR